MENMIIYGWEFVTTVWGVCPYCGEEVQFDLDYKELNNRVFCPSCDKEVGIDVSLIYTDNG
jgi:hypothetical protein